MTPLALRLINTENIVTTVPPAAVEFETPNAVAHGLSLIGQELIKFIQLSPSGYQHVGYPVAVTFHADTISGNHSLDALCTELMSTTPTRQGIRTWSGQCRRLFVSGFGCDGRHQWATQHAVDGPFPGRV